MARFTQSNRNAETEQDAVIKQKRPDHTKWNTDQAMRDFLQEFCVWPTSG